MCSQNAALKIRDQRTQLKNKYSRESSAPSLLPGHPARFSSLAMQTMSNRFDAKAKEAEGKLESAYGELTGDTGHKIQGKAKQVQAAAMNVAEDVKKVARSTGSKVHDLKEQDAREPDGKDQVG
jgi:uncharacterized protein YjbJ (UPF0337 family)